MTNVRYTEEFESWWNPLSEREQRNASSLGRDTPAATRTDADAGMRGPHAGPRGTGAASLFAENGPRDVGSSSGAPHARARRLGWSRTSPQGGRLHGRQARSEGVAKPLLLVRPASKRGRLRLVETITFCFERDDDYRLIPVNGVWGGRRPAVTSKWTSSTSPSRCRRRSRKR